MKRRPLYDFFVLIINYKMANVWLSFLKSFRAKHKGMSMKEAMKKAAVEYRKKKGGAGAAAEKPKRKRRKKKT